MLFVVKQTNRNAPKAEAWNNWSFPYLATHKHCGGFSNSVGFTNVFKILNKYQNNLSCLYKAAATAHRPRNDSVCRDETLSGACRSEARFISFSCILIWVWGRGCASAWALQTAITLARLVFCPSTHKAAAERACNKPVDQCTDTSPLTDRRTDGAAVRALFNEVIVVCFTVWKYWHLLWRGIGVDMHTLIVTHISDFYASFPLDRVELKAFYCCTTCIQHCVQGICIFFFKGKREKRRK